MGATRKATELGAAWDAGADGVSPGLEQLDLVDHYLTRLAATLDALSRDEVWQVVDVLLDACRRRSRVYLVGNGGSAATASHMANDLNKTARVDG
ncbi:MAG: SIS domain-containing protein, partial [Anaerolineae bacterium]